MRSETQGKFYKVMAIPKFYMVLIMDVLKKEMGCIQVANMKFRKYAKDVLDVT